MSKIRWGILGCANTARKRAIPAMLETRSVDLVGIASRSLEKAESFRALFNLPRAYGSYEEMLADPQIQAVYIPLPNGLHGEWMVNAARQGKHILCEKPFASNASEAARVAAILSEHGVYAMEAFMWRTHPQHARAVEAIDEGEVGTVRLIRAAFTFHMPRQPNVRFVPALAGGSVLDVGCYPVSTARYYFGCQPSRVYARGSIDPEYGVDMRASAMLEFPGGLALIDCGFDLPYRTELEIVGEKGIIAFHKPWQPDPEAVIRINGSSETLPPCNHYVRQFEYFSECVTEGTPPRWGPDDAILQMRVLDAILRSISSGRPESV
jgi:xylose dehydrogenase (NAD/NADP)